MSRVHETGNPHVRISVIPGWSDRFIVLHRATFIGWVRRTDSNRWHAWGGRREDLLQRVKLTEAPLSLREAVSRLLEHAAGGALSPPLKESPP